jgi:uncharacterized protein with NRDE domain
MCLILTSWQSHPEYPLVVLANRDEFYERATDQMHWWDKHTHILAGRDRADVKGQAGTWMGLTKTGRFAAITNIRAPSEKNPDALTRGEITAKFLCSADSPQAFVETNAHTFNRYNGFNLLATDLTHKEPSLIWLSNRVLMGKNLRPRKVMNPQRLNPGIYGLSNGMTQAPDDYLPQTGVSYEWEKVLSSAFIRTPNYGTRSTTLIRIRKDGRYEVIEKLFDPEKELNTQVFEGQLENFHNAKA